MPGGRGAVGAGRYPAFAGNPALASPQYVAMTILAGRNNMPSFARPAQPAFFFAPTWLSDEQVANVTNYIRSHFGNTHADTLDAADVRALRNPNEEKP
jgi:mono/diheme cytochrome c family protein